MMFGKTNSVIMGAGQATSSGELIAAVNNTGADLNVGDKVWLNQHLLENTDDIKTLYSTMRSPFPYPFNIKNTFYFNQESVLNKVAYSNSWSFQEVGQGGFTCCSVQYRDNFIWLVTNARKSVIMHDMGAFTEVNGYIVSDNLVVANNRLSSFDNTTGDITEGVLVNAGSSVLAAFKFGDVLFIGRDDKNVYFYDVSNVAQPQLIRSAYLPLGAHVVYATGLNVGDYLFTHGDYNSEEFNEENFFIYKIRAGYHLELATDVPQSLKSFLGQPARLSYNNATQILSVGNKEHVCFYKLINGVFSEFHIKFAPITSVKRSFLARLSDDMSTMAITYVAGGSYSYYYVAFYKLSVGDNIWYAEDYINSTALSCTGVVAEPENSDGVVMVKTVIADELSLDVVTDVEVDEIEVEGAN